MKTQVIFPLAAAAALLAPALRAQQDAVHFPDMTGAPGNVFQWPVRLSGPSAVVGLQFDLNYPAGQLTVSTGAQAAGEVPALATARELTPGHARVALTSTRNTPLPKDVVLELPLGLPATSPSGGPAYTVTKVILALADGTQVQAAQQFGPLTGWRQRYFTAAELLDGALIGDDADPDRDGAPNLLEYAMGGDPRHSLPGEKPTPGFGVLIDSGQRKLFLALNYRQAKNAPGITFQPEVSSNMRLWVKANTIVPAGTGDANATPMQARVLVGTERSQFLRLRVSRTGQ